ncbi:MAG: hypothetical protein IH986_12455 [Planctomycetes bacterium]|nr:hypothetical protein [Planctomycetota bacterium]
MGQAPTRKLHARRRTPPSLRWARKFLPHYFTDAPCEFHAELMADLERSSKRLVARVAPRGHAKSTCAAFAYPLWCICEQKCRNIAILTHESSLAKQFVRDIRNELESNEAILAKYGNLCADETPPERQPPDAAKEITPKSTPKTRKRSRPKWTESYFTTSTGITVQARGTGAGFRGTRSGPHRPDLIICDDIEKDEHVETPEGRRKLENWFRRVLMPALAPRGRIFVLGSLIHYDSLLTNLCDRKRFARWDYKVYRALEARPNGDGTFSLVALWPARWPVRRLQIERERVGTLAFEQEYQANPIDDSQRVFKPEWLRRYDPEKLDERKLTTLMAVDPATGIQGGDFFAIWVGSVERDTGIIYTRELTIDRIGIVEQVRRIIAAFERWKPVRIGIETTAYQVALKDVLDEHSRKQRIYMPIVALKTITNKLARIEGTSPLYENGTFRLPPVLAPGVEEQFLHFPKAKHDDAPDVCAMGIELARSLRAACEINGATGKRNPYARRGGW